MLFEHFDDCARQKTEEGAMNGNERYALYYAGVIRLLLNYYDVCELVCLILAFVHIKTDSI